MNQIPSGVFPLNRRSFPFDTEPVYESCEAYDSGNDEDTRKAAKKIGGNALIPEQYLPSPLSDFGPILNSMFAGSNLSLVRGQQHRHSISAIRRRNLYLLCSPSPPQ